MRFLIQCVDEASVQVDRNVTGAIEKGFLVLIGISDTDQYADCRPYDKKDVRASHI